MGMEGGDIHTHTPRPEDWQNTYPRRRGLQRKSPRPEGSRHQDHEDPNPLP